MPRKRDGLVPLGDVIADLPGTVRRSTKPHSKRSISTRRDFLMLLARASPGRDVKPEDFRCEDYIQT